jgi:hypothetical protein
MRMDEAILEKVRAASHDLWRGVGVRLGLRLVLLALVAAFWTTAAVRLLRAGTENSLRGPGMASGAGIVVLCLPVALAGLALAFLDAMRAVVVEGPLLPSLRNLFLKHEIQFRGPTLEDHFAAFTSSQRLSNLTRIRDLPLILFLVRMLLSQDVKPLLQVAAAGVGREGLIRRLEDQLRRQAADVIRRLRVAVILLLAVVLSIPQLAEWLFG